MILSTRKDYINYFFQLWIFRLIKIPYNYCRTIFFLCPIAKYEILVPSNNILNFPVLCSQKCCPLFLLQKSERFLRYTHIQGEFFLSWDIEISQESRIVRKNIHNWNFYFQEGKATPQKCSPHLTPWGCGTFVRTCFFPLKIKSLYCGHFYRTIRIFWDISMSRDKKLTLYKRILMAF